MYILIMYLVICFYDRQQCIRRSASTKHRDGDPSQIFPL